MVHKAGLGPVALVPDEFDAAMLEESAFAVDGIRRLVGEDGELPSSLVEPHHLGAMEHLSTLVDLYRSLREGRSYPNQASTLLVAGRELAEVSDPDTIREAWQLRRGGEGYDRFNEGFCTACGEAAAELLKAIDALQPEHTEITRLPPDIPGAHKALITAVDIISSALDEHSGVHRDRFRSRRWEGVAHTGPESLLRRSEDDMIQLSPRAITFRRGDLTFIYAPNSDGEGELSIGTSIGHDRLAMTAEQAIVFAEQLEESDLTPSDVFNFNMQMLAATVPYEQMDLMETFGSLKSDKRPSISDFEGQHRIEMVKGGKGFRYELSEDGSTTFLIVVAGESGPVSRPAMAEEFRTFWAEVRDYLDAASLRQIDSQVEFLRTTG